jgi:arylsulfatase
MAFSADEGADVGSDLGTAVASAYAVPFKFTGKIGKVTIELKPTTPAVADAADEGRRLARLKLALSN